MYYFIYCIEVGFYLFWRQK